LPLLSGGALCLIAATPKDKRGSKRGDLGLRGGADLSAKNCCSRKEHSGVGGGEKNTQAVGAGGIWGLPEKKRPFRDKKKGGKRTRLKKRKPTR